MYTILNKDFVVLFRDSREFVFLSVNSIISCALVYFFLIPETELKAKIVILDSVSRPRREFFLKLNVKKSRVCGIDCVVLVAKKEEAKIKYISI